MGQQLWLAPWLLLMVLNRGGQLKNHPVLKGLFGLLTAQRYALQVVITIHFYMIHFDSIWLCLCLLEGDCGGVQQDFKYSGSHCQRSQWAWGKGRLPRKANPYVWALPKSPPSRPSNLGNFFTFKINLPGGSSPPDNAQKNVFLFFGKPCL